MTILVREHKGITEIVLADPHVRNALDPEGAKLLRLALEKHAETSNAIVLSAEGPSFCSGGDLAKILELAAGGEDAVQSVIYAEFQGVARAIENSPVPIFSAVDGGAIGLGCDLALAGDITFMGRNGYLSQGWAKLGLVPAPGGVRLAMRKGGRRALWSLMHFQKIDGPTAQGLGLAVAVDDARAAALAAAEAVAKLPGEAVRATRALSRVEPFEEHLSQALAFQTRFLTSEAFDRRARALLVRL